jgi:acetylornithine deacetylase
MDTFKLLKKLIQIESPTGDEKQVVAFLNEYLQQISFKVVLQEVSQNRHNILASTGTPTVTLSTHTDTVSPYMDYAEDNDFIYGRGACDAKGIIVAQIKAAEKLLASGYSNFSLLFVVGEEALSDGARAANTLPNDSLYLINGEPTENRLAIGSKGTLRLKLICHGKAAHSAYPEQGESAINKLLEILNDLRRYTYPKNAQLGNTTFNIGKIKGGIQANVIPDYAEALLMFRVVTSVTDVKQILEKIVNKRGDIEYLFSCEPVMLNTLPGFDTMVAAFTTDIPNLTNWGKPFLIGPGSILDAHTAQEKIKKKDLLHAIQIYYDLVCKLL